MCLFDFLIYEEQVSAVQHGDNGAGDKRLGDSQHEDAGHCVDVQEGGHPEHQFIMFSVIGNVILGVFQHQEDANRKVYNQHEQLGCLCIHGEERNHEQQELIDGSQQNQGDEHGNYSVGIADPFLLVFMIQLSADHTASHEEQHHGYPP